MHSARKPGLTLPVVVTLAVLLGLYVGAYYAMVEPILDDELFFRAPRYPLYRSPSGYHGIGAVRFFAPVHWLDRRIRPHVW